MEKISGLQSAALVGQKVDGIDRMVMVIIGHGFDAWESENGGIVMIMPYADNGAASYEVLEVAPTWGAIREALGY